jgi:23S rRNA (adenine2030-N6)-methyltransferase
MRLPVRAPASRRGEPALSATKRLVYQHGFHAGCFQDVLKHTVLILLLGRMKDKASPFTYVETHAGAGIYDLDQALPHETEAGIFQLQRAAAASSPEDGLPAEARALLELVQQHEHGGAHQYYPGSPLVAASQCRPQDALALCELADDQHARLCAALEQWTPHATAEAMAMEAHLVDGYKALTKKHGGVATPDRRGLVFIDPPYSYGSDTQRATALARHLRVHWRSARLCVWYPATRAHSKVCDAFREAGVGECLAVELFAGGAVGKGSGMLIVHPPYGVEDELRRLLDGLTRALAREGEPPPEARVERFGLGES